MADVLYFGGPRDGDMDTMGAPTTFVDVPIAGAEPTAIRPTGKGLPLMNTDGRPCDPSGRPVNRYILRRAVGGGWRYVHLPLDTHTSQGTP
jgi:hypothetical protein